MGPEHSKKVRSGMAKAKKEGLRVGLPEGPEPGGAGAGDGDA